MRLLPAGNALSFFLVVTFTLCVLWGLATPASMHMHEAWAPMMPGFHWISFPAYLVGVLWAFVYGWYAALLFVPLYNFFSRKRAA